MMTLQTLDDQKYQNGMMTPVPLKNIQAFQDEGYQRDLMYMMFLASIAVSSRMIDTIDAAATARCAQALPGGEPTSGHVVRTAALRLSRPAAPIRPLFDPGESPSRGSIPSRCAPARTRGGAVSGDAFNRDGAVQQ